MLAACHKHGVPVTPRGTGTGNYGQAMPLSGGVVLSLADMNAVTSDLDRPRRRRPGRHRRRYRQGNARSFGPGTAASPVDLRNRLDRRLHRRRLGRRRLDQLRRLARFRQRAAPARRHHGGRTARARTDRRGSAQGDARLRHQRHHHRGRDAADAAYDWVDVIVGFDSFMGAARYGNALACQDGLLTKLVDADRRAGAVALFQAPPEVPAAKA